jgi:AAA+ superfamily predicted ATPase
MNIVLPNPLDAERAMLLNRFFYENSNGGANHYISGRELRRQGGEQHGQKHADFAGIVSAATLDLALCGKVLSGNDLVAIGRASIRRAFERNLTNATTAPCERDVLASARAFVPSPRRTYNAATLPSTPMEPTTATTPPTTPRTTNASTGWDAIGGLEDAKRVLLETVVWSYTRQSALVRLGIRPSKGVLLYGPPGTGKTLIASVAAKVAGINFVAVSFTDLIRSAVGESEAAIAAMFAEARKNSPCVLFIDEIQAIFGNRDDTGKAGQNMVSQLMQEIDGLAALSRGPTHMRVSSEQLSEHTAKHVVVLAATNAPHALDRALLRPGRIDRLVYVGLPDLLARVHICESLAHKIVSGRHRQLGASLVDGIREDKLFKASADIARLTDGFSGADITAVYQRAIGRALSLSQPVANAALVPQISPRHVHWVLKQGFRPSVSAQQVGALKNWGEATNDTQ